MIKCKFKTMDGNTAAAYIAYAFSEIASIYPITPSSVMAELVDKWSTMDIKNIFGQKVEVYEMQSEAGAAGTVHGSLSAGVLTTTFTASQGLLLMIPNMYKIAGELLPCVIHVSARAIASHALNIFGDHSDVMACRQTGFAILAASNVQEVMDLSIICHLSTIKGRIPFLHFFDGFRTSHEMQKIRVIEYSELKKMVNFNAINAFRKRALNPERPILRGSAQNSDIFFQAREASNKYYNELPNIVEEYMNIINKKFGTDYSLFNYYGAKNATRIIVAMGSVCDTIEEVVDYLNKNDEKVGLIKVRLYRPFNAKKFINSIPITCKNIAVLDRTKEPGAYAEPMHLDILAALNNSHLKNHIQVIGGRYGLGSKDTNPSSIFAVYDNLKDENMKNNFTIGIIDDVTHLSLPLLNLTNVIPKETISCKFWGLGSDGTVGANKNTIKIIGDNTNLYVQAYFSYDSKKSGGITISHLRFGKNKIKSTYLINQADFIACHNYSYINKYNIIEGLKKNGSFLLNCPWDLEEMENKLPDRLKYYLAINNINFYIINGVEIAKKLNLGGKINTILQAAFFKIIQIINVDEAVNLMKQAIIDTYGNKGQKIVEINHQAILEGINGVKKIKIPISWKKLLHKKENIKINNIINSDLNFYVNNILIPVNKQIGDTLPVSKFIKYADGSIPQGSSMYEKRGIANEVPKWLSKNCIQCAQCSYVCPHSVIRPFILNNNEKNNAPKTFQSLKMFGKNNENFEFNLSISVLDCTGCGICAKICPGYKGNKALEMNPLNKQLIEQENFNYCINFISDKNVIPRTTLKGSQFKKPLLEFSGACAGCGETPYAKLITQLFGERMYIANATGCSSIWGGSAPSTPYTKNLEGFGPAWSNSLFEDNAEFGFGIFLAVAYMREKMKILILKLKQKYIDNIEIKDVFDDWIKHMDNTEKSLITSKILIKTLLLLKDKNSKYILNNKEFLSKKSIWIIGGDGWAYDIGFGGLDHIVSSNANVNILIFDTELYSNTGGQASKSTPIGQVCQFASAGKSQAKKNLAEIIMTYEHVYVAQISMGADYNQTIKALIEAEEYNGPSVIIAYAPCINHGIKAGMSNAQNVMKKAVLSGYWHLFRRNPQLKLQGKNTFLLDSNAPTIPYDEFLDSETRFTSLKMQFPNKAKELSNLASKNALEKYLRLKKMSEIN